MKNQSRLLRKSYAMHRMAEAIERAVVAATDKEKERAARWVGAWGLLCGINTSTVRLRDSDIERLPERRQHRASQPARPGGRSWNGRLPIRRQGLWE
jgi:hypothetical protein